MTRRITCDMPKCHSAAFCEIINLKTGKGKYLCANCYASYFLKNMRNKDLIFIRLDNTGYKDKEA